MSDAIVCKLCGFDSSKQEIPKDREWYWHAFLIPGVVKFHVCHDCAEKYAQRKATLVTNWIDLEGEYPKRWELKIVDG